MWKLFLEEECGGVIGFLVNSFGWLIVFDSWGGSWVFFICVGNIGVYCLLLKCEISCL